LGSAFMSPISSDIGSHEDEARFKKRGAPSLSSRYFESIESVRLLGLKLLNRYGLRDPI
jgi:hypothetical protein